MTLKRLKPFFTRNTKLSYTLFVHGTDTPCQYLGNGRLWLTFAPSLFFITLILSLTCAACASAPTTTNSPLGLLVPGTLTVASDISNPPFEFINDHTQQPTGFDLDLITAIAQHLGLKVNILNTKIEILVSDLTNNRYDVAISALPITPDLQTKASTIPYYTIGESLVVAAANPQHIQSLTDICGLSVGVQDGSRAQVDLQNASSICQQQGKSPITITVQKNQFQLMQLLRTQHLAATFQDSATSDYFLHLYPGLFTLGSPILNATTIGIAINKDNTALTTTLQTTLNTMKSNGSFAQLLAKWGLTNETLPSSMVRISLADILGWGSVAEDRANKPSRNYPGVRLRKCFLITKGN